MTGSTSRTTALRTDAALCVLALAVAAGYLVLGVGRVMDDWFLLHDFQVDGVRQAMGTEEIGARPMAAALYAVVFGAFDDWVAPTVVLMAVLNAASAMLLRRLVATVAPAPLATATAVCWIVLPTTTSLEAWAAVANITASLTTGLAALWLARRAPCTTASVVGAGLLAAVSVLSYEVTLVLLVPVAVAWLALDRRGCGRACIAIVVAASTSFSWMLLHWNSNKRVTSAWGDVAQVVPANFTWGIAPRGIGVVIGAVVLLVSVSVLAGVPGGGRLDVVRLPLAAGWALVGLGVLPFLKYTYAPVGAGDRANIVSSLGGALVLACVLWVLAGPAAARYAAAVVVLLAISLQPRLLMMRSWALAGDDAALILEAARSTVEPGDAVVLGPALVDRNGVTAVQHSDIFSKALRLALGTERVAGTLTQTVEEFEDQPGVHLDVRLIIPDPGAPGHR